MVIIMGTVIPYIMCTKTWVHIIYCKIRYILTNDNITDRVPSPFFVSPVGRWLLKYVHFEAYRVFRNMPFK